MSKKGLKTCCPVCRESCYELRAAELASFSAKVRRAFSSRFFCESCRIVFSAKLPHLGGVFARKSPSRRGRSRVEFEQELAEFSISPAFLPSREKNDASESGSDRLVVDYKQGDKSLQLAMAADGFSEDSLELFSRMVGNDAEQINQRNRRRFVGRRPAGARKRNRFSPGVKRKVSS